MDNPPLSGARARALVADMFTESLATDFAAHVDDVVETIRRENPVAYLRFAASFVPKQLPPGDPLGGISDAELDEMIQHLRAQIAAKSAAERKDQR